MNTLFLALFRPTKGLQQLKSESFSAMNLAIILLLMLINLILNMPIDAKVVQIMVSSESLEHNQALPLTEIAHKMRYLQVAGVEIWYVFMFLFYAFLLHLSVRIAKNKIEYKKVLQLLVCCYFIVTIGDLVNTALIYIRGIDAMNNMYDAYLTGLNVLTSIERIGTTRYVFLGYITPFQLWFVALLSIGLKIFTDMKLLKSAIISILFWLITILLPVLFMNFSQSTISNTGMM